MHRFLTALEHQPIPITQDGSGRSLTPAEAEMLAQIGEQRPGFCEIGQRKVKLAQYCGIVGLGERVLEILPKVQDGMSTAEECRGVLLRLLRHTERFPFFQHQAASQHLRTAPLLEAFIAAFFDAVTVLTRGGLLSQYEEREDDLTVVRGRISITRQLRTLANRSDMVACVFDELSVDNVWNRVLKKAIRGTRAWIRGVDLSRQWVELMGVFDGVHDERLSHTDVACMTFHRHAERYRTGIEWARWILALLSPSLRAGRSAAPALLFDMNRLFESAVTVAARRQIYGVSGITVEAQDSSRALATLVSQGRVEAGFVLRPDLVFRRGDAIVAIADAKWKLVGSDRRNRPMPGEADMYQMHAYAAAFQCSELALIYPWHSALADAQDTVFLLPATHSRPATVSVLCVDVDDDALTPRLGRWPTTV